MYPNAMNCLALVWRRGRIRTALVSRFAYQDITNRIEQNRRVEWDEIKCSSFSAEPIRTIQQHKIRRKKYQFQ